ncbi:DUF6879 family protein [Streptomyces sp. NPDC087769]|uniref:DUF6879 family protein n=1 Tax=unclassified Streptomyces TaxID=2593676 RepID=UPI00371397E6
MTTSSKTLGDLFDAFKHEAFRLETLDDYSRSGNVDAYRAFLAGETQPDDCNADWIWFFESESVSVMNYDGSGKYLRSEVLPPERTAEFTHYRDVALAHAEPFTDWWAKYGV